MKKRSKQPKQKRRDAHRELVLSGTDGQCSLCLESVCTKKSTFEIQVGHIVSEKAEGPYEFWNLSPICNGCNTAKRESGTNPKLQLDSDCEKAFYYWSFCDGRTVIALKVALYRLYEIAALAPEFRSEARRSAIRWLDHAAWQGRFKPHPRFISTCHRIKRAIQHSSVDRGSDAGLRMERALLQHDLGHWGPLRTLLGEDALAQEVVAKAKSIVWRIKQNPSTEERSVIELEDAAPYHVALESGYYLEERATDASLRELVSELGSALARSDRKQVQTVIDGLNSQYGMAIVRGTGCSSTYQRMHLMLGGAQSLLGGRNVEGLSFYAWQHGSRGHARQLSYPSGIFGSDALARFPKGSVKKLDRRIGITFEPVVELSYSHLLLRAADLVDEADLVDVITRIGAALENRHRSGNAA